MQKDCTYALKTNLDFSVIVLMAATSATTPVLVTTAASTAFVGHTETALATAPQKRETSPNTRR